MEQKYFTPDIADLKIGYEYQEFRGTNDELRIPEKYNDNSLWETHTIEKDYYSCGSCRDSDMGDLLLNLRFGRIRVPYLTCEQIESEGWEVFDNISYKKGSWHFTLGFPLISINNFKGFGCFSGSCPSINELRLIQKLLNIQ